MIPTIIHHYGTEGVQGHIGGDVEDNNNHNYNYTNTNPDIGFLSLSSYSSYAGKVAMMTILVVSGVGLVGGLVFLLCYFTNSANNIVVMGGVALLSCILIVICYTKPISMLTSFEDDEVKDDEPPAYEDVMMEPPPPSYFTVVNENPYTNNTPTGTTTTTTTTTTTLPSQYQLHVAPKDAPLFSKLLMKMGGLMGQTVCRSGRIYYGSDSSVPSTTAAGGVAGVGESVVRRSGVSMVCTRPVIREGHVVHSHGSGGLCGGGSGWPSRALQQVSARINPTLSRNSHPTSPPPPPPPGQGGENKVVKNTHILPHEFLVQSSTTSLSTRLRKSPSTPILTSPSSDITKRQSVTSVVSRSRVSCPFFLGTSSTTAALSKKCYSSSTDDSYSSTNLKSSCYPSTKELTTSFPDYYSSSFSTSFPDYYSSSSTSFPDYSSYSTASFPDYSLSFPDYSTSTTSFRRSSSTPYLNSCTDAFSSSCHTSTSPTTPAKPTPYTSSSSSLSPTSFLRRSSSTPFVSALLVPSFPSSGTLGSSKSSSDVNNTSKPAASTTTSSCSSTPTSLPSFHRSSSFPYLTSLSTSNNTSTSSSVYNPPFHRISYSTPSSPITGTRLVHHHHHHHSNTLSPNIRPRRQRVSIESPPPASVIVEVDSEASRKVVVTYLHVPKTVPLTHTNTPQQPLHTERIKSLDSLLSKGPVMTNSTNGSVRWTGRGQRTPMEDRGGTLTRMDTLNRG
ncbi:hypothetical protein Pmani_031632 [Petrolisthes manimaculis]|uniref:Uncharacterized protein n=1 Tax=Petrolisthes manimaculis TaxID=1843537 RepID=A0AAE1NUZ7_9EUCA|nr:hypothetical protein Pmani_031632 [Petrolisthes manimaculis]